MAKIRKTILEKERRNSFPENFFYHFYCCRKRRILKYTYITKDFSTASHFMQSQLLKTAAETNIEIVVLELSKSKRFLSIGKRNNSTKMKKKSVKLRTVSIADRKRDL